MRCITNFIYPKTSNKKHINFYLIFFLDFEVKDIDQVFDQIRYLNYPKNNIHLRIYFDDDLHEYKISRFIEKFETDYLSVSKHKVNKSKSEKRDISIRQSLEYNVDYIINFDCNYIFRNRESLKYLNCRKIKIYFHQ